MILSRWLALASLLLPLSIEIGCGPDGSGSDDSTTTSTSTPTPTSTGTTAMPMVDGSDSAGGGSRLEQCMGQIGIELDCSAQSRFEYIAFGDVLGCSGGSSSTEDEQLHLLFTGTVDDEIQVSALQVVKSAIDDEIEFRATAPEPTQLSALPAEIMGWTGDLQGPLPGPLFIEGGTIDVTLDAVPTQAELNMGPIEVSGTFEIVGGTVTNIGEDVDDPGIMAFGCFVTPASVVPAP